MKQLPEASILIENASLHNLDIDRLSIPLNKLVVVTGASGSGKTSLIYDTLAIEAERLFNFANQTPKFNLENSFSETRISGLTPIKSLSQKFDYYNRNLNFAQFINIDRYLNTLYANFGIYPNQAKQCFNPTEVFKLLQNYPKLTEELLSETGYGNRYLICFPLPLLLIPGISKPAKPEDKDLDLVYDYNIQLVETLNNYLDQQNHNIEFIVINKHYVIDLFDLEDAVDELPDYITDLHVMSYPINKDQEINQEVKAFIDGAQKEEEIFFKDLITYYLHNDIKAVDIFEQANLKLKRKKSKLEFSESVIKDLRTLYPPTISIYNPFPQVIVDYPLANFIENNDKVVEVNLNKVSNFIPNISPFKCKTCNGAGEIDEENEDKTTCRDCGGTGFNEVINDLTIFEDLSYRKLMGSTLRSIYPRFKSEYDKILQKLANKSEQKHDSHSLDSLKANLIKTITDRLAEYKNIGLDYIQLNRKAISLSGGEIQRSHLVNTIVEETSGVTYILDEPSIGLHFKDNSLLLEKLKRLVANHNSCIVIEHDADFIKAAEHLIALEQGKVVFEGTIPELLETDLFLAKQLRGDFLTSQKISALHNQNYQQKLEKERKRTSQESLRYIMVNTDFEQSRLMDYPALIEQAKQEGLDLYTYLSPFNPNYLQELEDKYSLVFHGVSYGFFKNVDIEIKKEAINVITGISGSGKTSLASRVIYNSLKKLTAKAEGYKGKRLYLKNGNHNLKELVENLGVAEISGATKAPGTNRWYFDRIIFANQKPDFSKNNLLSYFELSNALAEVFYQSTTEVYRTMQDIDLKSFKLTSPSNKHRCAECKGKQTISINIAKDISENITCPTCNGTGLDLVVNGVYLQYDKNSKVKYNISEFSNLSVNKAYDFLLKYHNRRPSSSLKTLLERLALLKRFRLGELNLGTSVQKFSGGELQRIYLAKELLLKKKDERCLIIIDEPTTGLHFDDIQSLLDFLVQLKQEQNTIIIIEHNTDIIFSADHLIELGPGPDVDGGEVIFNGSIAQLITAAKTTENPTPMMTHLTEYSNKLKTNLTKLEQKFS